MLKFLVFLIYFSILYLIIDVIKKHAAETERVSVSSHRDWDRIYTHPWWNVNIWTVMKRKELWLQICTTKPFWMIIMWWIATSYQYLTDVPSLINISFTFSDYLESFDLPDLPNPDIYFYCPNDCGRKYKWKRDVTRHLKYECGGKKSFKCTICHKSFSHKTTLKTHMINKHEIVITLWLFNMPNYLLRLILLYEFSIYIFFLDILCT